MSSIFDTIQQQFGGAAITQISQRLGVDPAMTQMAVNAAIPAILGGMAAHAAHSKGADEIHQEADNHAAAAQVDAPPAPQAGQASHSSHTGALGNVPNVFTGKGDGGGLLGKLVGHRHQAVQDGVAQASGLDTDKAGQIAGMIAPMIAGALGAKRQQGGLEPGQLGDVLRQEQEHARAGAERSSPGMGGILGSVLSGITAR